MRRLVRLAGCGFVSVSVVGCYTLRPTLGTEPVIGAQVALDITDAGRAALGGTIGPEVGQIEGRLVERDSGETVVAASLLHLIHGGEQVWNGEKIRVKNEYVSRTYEREFSKSRSMVMGALGAGALVAIVTRSILGGGQQEQGKNPSDTSHSFGRRFAHP